MTRDEQEIEELRLKVELLKEKIRALEAITGSLADSFNRLWAFSRVLSDQILKMLADEENPISEMNELKIH